MKIVLIFFIFLFPQREITYPRYLSIEKIAQLKETRFELLKSKVREDIAELKYK